VSHIEKQKGCTWKKENNNKPVQKKNENNNKLPFGVTEQKNTPEEK